MCFPSYFVDISSILASRTARPAITSLWFEAHAPNWLSIVAALVFPAVLEDLAVVVDEAQSNERVVEVIRQGGGKLLRSVRLFDIFRGEQIGAGKKSLAYSLAYQAPDHTLTEAESNQVRGRIIRRLEQELGAKLRS